MRVRRPGIVWPKFFVAAVAVVTLLAPLAAADTPNLSSLDFPVLVVSSDRQAGQAERTWVDLVADRLAGRGVTVISAATCRAASDRLDARKDIGAVIVDWDLAAAAPGTGPDPAALIADIRAGNDALPIFLMTGRADIRAIPTAVLTVVEGFIRKNEDTPDFIAGTVRQAVAAYREAVLPPFFKALVGYVDSYKYAWSTPGHAGGLGFLASAPGTAFFDFFGETILRADLSSSMPELGSILEHQGPAGDAEAEAAETFGADHTFFVLNGTSTANKMVWHSLVTAGDVVLVDRNCHKSIMHAIIMTRAIPIYLTPTRNAYGIIGPIPLRAFDPELVAKAIEASPLAKDGKRKRIRVIVITNSTYDGLCYDVIAIKKRALGLAENLHFDEAWYGYARFHPLYHGRYGMSVEGEAKDHPPTFATQSTHKLLAAFSQGSMIHIKNGGGSAVDPERFNEAFLMHESTSPFYPLFASIDVSARMMAGASGRRIMEETIREAVTFRKKMLQVGADEAGSNGWWFTVWQPEMYQSVPFGQVTDEALASDPAHWTLKEGEAWHGFKGIQDDHILLDPIKVTLLTPGINPDGTMAESGIPAGVVSRYLQGHGVIPEKTGYYNFLFLFAPGVTRGKAGTLVARLAAFKSLYDRNALLDEVFPDLAARYPDRYAGKPIRELCQEMHRFLKLRNLPQLTIASYAELPEQTRLPAEAYEELVRGRIERVPVRDLLGRTAAAMVVPYPPGIPVMMPGESFTAKNRPTLDYLVMCEDFDNLFPGFEGEIHGVVVEKDKGRSVYKVNCLAGGAQPAPGRDR